MAMVKYSAKTRLPSHVELSTKATYWRFYTKNKYGYETLSFDFFLHFLRFGRLLSNLKRRSSTAKGH
jgi:hypothetical protein